MVGDMLAGGTIQPPRMVEGEVIRECAGPFIRSVLSAGAATVASWTGEAVEAVNRWSDKGTALAVNAEHILERAARPSEAVDFATGRLLIGASQRKYLRASEREEIMGATLAYRRAAQGRRITRWDATRYARGHLASTIATIRGREAVLSDWPGWAGYFKAAESVAATPAEADAFVSDRQVQPIVRAAFALGWHALKRTPLNLPPDVAAMVEAGKPHLSKVWKMGEHLARASACIEAMEATLPPGREDPEPKAPGAEPGSEQIPESEAEDMIPDTDRSIEDVKVSVEPTKPAGAGLEEGSTRYSAIRERVRPGRLGLDRMKAKSAPLVAQLRRLAWEGRDTFDVERGRERGALDEGALHRLALDHDPRVFESHADEGRQAVAVSLLVDCSGSMRSRTDTGTRIGDAKAVAYALRQAFADNRRVRITCTGHDVTYRHGLHVSLYPCPTPEDIAGLEAGGDNADGHAIAAVARELATAPEPVRLLVLLADGYPSARGYGSLSASQHVRRVIEAAERCGIQFLALGIEGCLSQRVAESMYGPGRFISIGNARRAGPLLVRKLSRMLKGGAA
jgi:Mg-chelatase subunit ChlD